MGGTPCCWVPELRPLLPLLPLQAGRCGAAGDASCAQSRGCCCRALQRRAAEGRWAAQGERRAGAPTAGGAMQEGPALRGEV